MRNEMWTLIDSMRILSIHNDPECKWVVVHIFRHFTQLNLVIATEVVLLALEFEIRYLIQHIKGEKFENFDGKLDRHDRNENSISSSFPSMNIKLANFPQSLSQTFWDIKWLSTCCKIEKQFFFICFQFCQNQQIIIEFRVLWTGKKNMDFKFPWWLKSLRILLVFIPAFNKVSNEFYKFNMATLWSLERKMENWNFLEALINWFRQVEIRVFTCSA